MASFEGFERERPLERDSRKARSKNPRFRVRGILSWRPSILRHTSLYWTWKIYLRSKSCTESQESLIWNFPNLMHEWTTGLSPCRLGVYKEAFEAGLIFSLPSFLLELLRFYGISLCTLTPNSLRVVLGFLIICFLAKVRPSLPSFHAFYTIERYPYTKEWWYFSA